MTAQEWKPGDKAYVEVEVDAAYGVPVPNGCRWVSVVGTSNSNAIPERLLLPASVPDGDVIERVRDLFALYGVDRGQASDLVREFMDRGLLAGGVPGRSEGEWTQRIEGGWLISTTDRCTCSPHYGAHERHCGTEPELDLSTLPGWRSEAEVKAEALREFADTRGVNVGDEDDDWWRGYRAAQRECFRDAIKAADQVADTEGSE